jgi:hypothetical protein
MPVTIVAHHVLPYMSRGVKTKTAQVINLSISAIACEAILRNPSTGGINQLVIYRRADSESQLRQRAPRRVQLGTKLSLDLIQTVKF